MTDDPRTIEERFFEAMDAEAFRMLERMANTDVDETGQPIVSDKQREATFRVVMEWMSKSKRLRPADSDDVPEGVRLMRQIIADPPAPAKPKTGVKPKPRPPMPPPPVQEGSALNKALGDIL